MKIEVLGSGCAACRKLLALTEQAAGELGLSADVRYVTDMREIAKTGVMRLPALLVDGRVRTMGRTPGLEEIKKILLDARE